MKKLFTALTLMVLAVTICAATAHAFDPPRIIGHLTASQPSVNDFATDFVCVGDQNGDGFDDLLVNHGTWDNGYGDQPFSNRVELYFGGQQMDSIPDFTIAGQARGPVGFGERLYFLPRLRSQRGTFWAIQETEETDNYRIWKDRILLFEAGEELDDEPDYLLRTSQGNGLFLGLGRRSNSMDFDNDGFTDLMVARYNGDMREPVDGNLEVYFGGDNFDTLSDWHVTIPSYNLRNFEYSGGYDVNGDRYDDVIVRYSDRRTNPRKLLYAFYLGGQPMDTVAVWEFYEDCFQDTAMTSGFAMVPDVNGDGFDDWVIHYQDIIDNHSPTDPQGYYLYYGGRNPDPDYDVRLDGAPSAWGVEAEVVGGDINGDGFGDVICTNTDGFSDNGSVQIYFGSQWFSSRASITVNCLSQYGELANGLGEFVGGIGNYSGDETLDFVTTHHGGRPNSGNAQAYVLAGQRNWRVDVKSDVTTPKQFELSLSTAPNPFNNSIRIEYSVSEMSNIKLVIFDVSGRQIALLDEAKRGSEPVLVDWSSESSGVFLVVLSSINPNSAPKRIMQKIVCIR